MASVSGFGLVLCGFVLLRAGFVLVLLGPAGQPDLAAVQVDPLAAEESPTSSRVDCSRRFSSSMWRLPGLKSVSMPHCVMASGYAGGTAGRRI